MRDSRYGLMKGEGRKNFKERSPIRSAAGCPGLKLLRGLFTSHSYPIDRFPDDMYKAYAILYICNSIPMF